MSPGLLVSSRRAPLSTSEAQVMRPKQAQRQADIHAGDELLAKSALNAHQSKSNEAHNTSWPFSGTHRAADNTMTQGGVLSEGATCDCGYRDNFLQGGCIITQAAPSGMACKCEAIPNHDDPLLSPQFYCIGHVVGCTYNNTNTCAHPSTDVSSCFMGEGDCGGYTGVCDCNYHFDFMSNGCYISKPAPAGVACLCKYEGFWTCSGGATYCLFPSTTLCSSPDCSYASCMNGGGDCGGYDYIGK